MILSALELVALAAGVGTGGFVLARFLDARAAREFHEVREGLLHDLDQVRRRLGASRSEIVALERGVRAEREEIERLDAQLISAELERNDLRARLARRTAPGAARRLTATNGTASSAVGSAAPRPPHEDDLERIRGIGPTIARRLRAHGVRAFGDIVAWSTADLERVAAAVRVPVGRILRDRWGEQATLLQQPRDAAGAKAGVAIPA